MLIDTAQRQRHQHNCPVCAEPYLSITLSNKYCHYHVYETEPHFSWERCDCESKYLSGIFSPRCSCSYLEDYLNVTQDRR